MGEVVYTSLQISNHDARINDNESNLREIMGKVDRIQEDLQRLVNMNQGSKVNETPVAAAHPMEEESVVQPMKPEEILNRFSFKYVNMFYCLLLCS